MNDLGRAQAQLEQLKAELDQALKQICTEAELKKAEKKPGTARGLETMFRAAYRVQMDLTGLADNKANMMISINGIIMSIIIASVAPKLDANPWLLIPTTALLIGNLVSMVFAILSARPRVSHPTYNPADPDSRNPGNLLYFGTFANLNEDEYVADMQLMMEDKAAIYEAMIRNLHGLGSVLYTKFVMLQYAYTSFMAALVIGVSAFIGVFIWLSGQTAPVGL